MGEKFCVLNSHELIIMIIIITKTMFIVLSISGYVTVVQLLSVNIKQYQLFWYNRSSCNFSYQHLVLRDVPRTEKHLRFSEVKLEKRLVHCNK